MSTNGTVILGVTGSIAAYKSADLTSKLAQGGYDVHVIMTESAAKLVQPQTFLTLSRNPVTTDLWELQQWRPGHIALADRADLLVVAPATANFIGKYANGIADDALTTYALSHTGPVAVAPAMNPKMWSNPVVQANCDALRKRGVHIVTPDTGHVACGAPGEGRLPSVEVLLETVRGLLNPVAEGKGAGAGIKVLVTAGPTREAIDPVRFISNRSTGKMGYAVAAAAVAAGCETTLITGPTGIEPPEGCHVVPVTTAAEMAEAVKNTFPACDILVMTAAVADYRPASEADQKIKKGAEPLALELSRTEDILASLKDLKRADQVVVGFAAETENLREGAQAKLEAKPLDWLVANDVSRTDIGFASDDNAVTILSRKGIQEWPRMPKTEVASKLMALVLGARSS